MKKLFIIFVMFFISCSGVKNGDLLFIEANSEFGFNYPYFLFIPDNAPKDHQLTMIIEPNNSGFVDDDLIKHIEKARRTASREFYLGNYVSRKLQTSLLVPVFPRSKTNWKIYTHALDRDVMLQKDTDLERIDLQLLAMASHGKTKLSELGYTCNEKYFMTGFSASGTFANRFTLLHSDKIQAVAAGGVNGLLMLPMDELNGEKLNYPLGVNDFEEITSKPFNFNAFKNTPQFYFMGALDSYDAIPYDDGYSEKERKQVYDLLGKEMQPQRWEACQAIYQDQGINAIIKTYDNTGHEQAEDIKVDVLKFFQENL